jgi:hypothetical protein
MSLNLKSVYDLALKRPVSQGKCPHLRERAIPRSQLLRPFHIGCQYLSNAEERRRYPFGKNSFSIYAALIFISIDKPALVAIFTSLSRLNLSILPFSQSLSRSCVNPNCLAMTV